MIFSPDNELRDRAIYGTVYLLMLFGCLWLGLTFWRLVPICMILCYELFFLPPQSRLARSIIIGYIAIGISAWSSLSEHGIALPAIIMVVATDSAAYLGGKYIDFNLPNPSSFNMSSILWYATSILLVILMNMLLSLVLFEGFISFIIRLALLGATLVGIAYVIEHFNIYSNVPNPMIISPNKTLEGYLFGILGSALAGIALKISGYVISWDLFLLITFGAFAGDLLGSAMKRDKGVKDFSGLIPGHGGLWDRLDSVLLSGTLLAIYQGII